MSSPIGILNDVLGPVMRGPSSSHTAGAYRIARIALDLLGADPVEARCVFDPSGSYAPTYKALGVENALCAGLLGWELTDTRYSLAMTAAAEAGIALNFHVESLPWASHPNDLRLDLVPPDGPALSVRANSPGGGAICIHSFNGHAVHLDGRAWEVLVEGPRNRLEETRIRLRRAMPEGREEISSSGDRAQLHWRAFRGVDQVALAALRTFDPEVHIMSCEPILHPPVEEASLLSAADFIRRGESTGAGLGEIAQEHESQLLGMTESDLLDEMRRRHRIMESSIREGLDGSGIAMAWLRPSASQLRDAEAAGQLPMGGPQTRAAARALAVMHTCNSRGIVCAAPTGGSAGVIPGVLSVLAEEMNLDDRAILRALFAAGAIGSAFASRATFAAETAGCQVEIGAAGAMAAAAVVEAAGGTARQACDAASIALQNTMGSVCDPVGGGCEIPCHTRNAIAASAAFTLADLVIGGFANPIPLDEAIDASLIVGQALPPELRCTARGGIAVTPSARRLVAESEHRVDD